MNLRGAYKIFAQIREDNPFAKELKDDFLYFNSLLTLVIVFHLASGDFEIIAFTLRAP